MKTFNEYDYDEIETISHKFGTDFVTNEELELFKDFKKSLEKALESKKHFEKAGTIIPELQELFNEAETIYETIRKVPTFDLHKVCEYLVISDNYTNHHVGNHPLSVEIAKKVLEGVSEAEEQFAREVLEKSNSAATIQLVRELTTPIKHRHWFTSWNNPTTYFPEKTPRDNVNIYDGKTHYIYIQSECQGRYGDTFWFSDNCYNTLDSLPVIKAFKEFNFEVDKFYKIICTDTIHFGKKKKRYVFDIQESTEEEFLEKGFVEFAKGE